MSRSPTGRHGHRFTALGLAEARTISIESGLLVRGAGPPERCLVTTGVAVIRPAERFDARQEKWSADAQPGRDSQNEWDRTRHRSQQQPTSGRRHASHRGHEGERHEQRATAGHAGRVPREKATDGRPLRRAPQREHAYEESQPCHRQDCGSSEQSRQQPDTWTGRSRRGRLPGAVEPRIGLRIHGSMIVGSPRALHEALYSTKRVEVLTTAEAAPDVATPPLPAPRAVIQKPMDQWAAWVRSAPAMPPRQLRVRHRLVLRSPEEHGVQAFHPHPEFAGGSWRKHEQSVLQLVPGPPSPQHGQVNSASRCLHRRLVPWTRTDHTLGATATMPGDNRSRSSTRTAAFAAPDRPGTSRYRAQGLPRPRSRDRSEAGVLRGTAPSDATHGRHPHIVQDRPDRTQGAVAPQLTVLASLLDSTGHRQLTSLGPVGTALGERRAPECPPDTATCGPERHPFTRTEVEHVQ